MMREQEMDEMKRLVGDVLESYRKYPQTCNIGTDNLLNQEIIIEILQKIR